MPYCNVHIDPDDVLREIDDDTLLDALIERLEKKARRLGARIPVKTTADEFRDTLEEAWRTRDVVLFERIIRLFDQEMRSTVPFSPFDLHLSQDAALGLALTQRAVR